MKLYLTRNLKIDEILILKYKFKVSKLNLYYTDDGIIEVVRDKLKKYIINDEPTERIKYNNNNFIIDNSYFTTEDHYQISNYNIFINKSIIEYKLRQRSIISFVIEKQDNEILDYYFKINTKDKNIDAIDKKDIDTFLSLLNFS